MAEFPFRHQEPCYKKIPPLSRALGLSKEADSPSVKDLIDVHNENKQLRSELEQTTSSLKLLIDYIAPSNPDFNNLGEDLKYIMQRSMILS